MAEERVCRAVSGPQDAVLNSDGSVTTNQEDQDMIKSTNCVFPFWSNNNKYTKCTTKSMEHNGTSHMHLVLGSRTQDIIITKAKFCLQNNGKIHKKCDGAIMRMCLSVIT